MRILNVKMVCPKCKKEYINHSLASYSSGFKTPAKNFLDNNKPTTHCENCNIKLVKEKLINYFDDIGNYSPLSKKLNFGKDFDLFNLYLEVLNSIKDFFECVSNGKIILTGNFKKEEKEIYTNIILIGKTDDKEYELLSTIIEKYTLIIGGRKNLFIQNSLIDLTNSIISTIYNYLFIDDCNRFNDNDKLKITQELIQI